MFIWHFPLLKKIARDSHVLSEQWLGNKLHVERLLNTLCTKENHTEQGKESLSSETKSSSTLLLVGGGGGKIKKLR